MAFSGNNLAILGPPNYYRENFDFQDRFKDSANHRELNTYLDWPSSAGFTSDCVC